MKTDLFQSCGHCWVFQICWYIEYSTLIASSSRILNSLAGILSPPLALLVVMLPKAHLTSYSKMSGSRWVTPSLWLCQSLRPFLYSSSLYSCHLFLISSASVRSFLLSCPSLHEMFLWYIHFSQRDVWSFPFYCFFFFFLFLCIVHWRRPSYLSLLLSRTLHSVGCIFPFLPCFLLLFFPQLFVKLNQITTLASYISFSFSRYLFIFHFAALGLSYSLQDL